MGLAPADKLSSQQKPKRQNAGGYNAKVWSALAHNKPKAGRLTFLWTWSSPRKERPSRRQNLGGVLKIGAIIFGFGVLKLESGFAGCMQFGLHLQDRFLWSVRF
jgi:hypothetical protein